MMIISQPGIQKTEGFAGYMSKLLAAELGSGQNVYPPECPLDFLEEMNFAVKLIKQAMQNKKIMKWSVAQYVQGLLEEGKRCTGMQTEVEKRLRAQFPPAEKVAIAAPCLIVDSEEIVLFWFLPGLLDSGRQEHMWDSLEIIQTRLVVKEEESSNWRVNSKFYRPPTECTYKPGTVSFGLAWYQQGMKGKRDMEVSAELRRPAAAAWIATMAETSTLLGAVLGVIHPPTFKTGVDCVRGIEQCPEIAKRENLDELLKVWTSPCVAGSIINNRNTPLHRDNGASFGSMDLLASVGNFYNGRFMVPSLGYEFLFSSGTVFGLLGRIVPHAAEVSGERLCFANYLRENILSTLGVEEPGWIKCEQLIRI